MKFSPVIMLLALVLVSSAARAVTIKVKPPGPISSVHIVGGMTDNFDPQNGLTFVQDLQPGVPHKPGDSSFGFTSDRPVPVPQGGLTFTFNFTTPAPKSYFAYYDTCTILADGKCDPKIPRVWTQINLAGLQPLFPANFQIQFLPIPEPSNWALLLAGMAPLVVARRLGRKGAH